MVEERRYGECYPNPSDDQYDRRQQLAEKLDRHSHSATIVPDAEEGDSGRTEHQAGGTGELTPLGIEQQRAEDRTVHRQSTEQRSGTMMILALGGLVHEVPAQGDTADQRRRGRRQKDRGGEDRDGASPHG